MSPFGHRRDSNVRFDMVTEKTERADAVWRDQTATEELVCPALWSDDAYRRIDQTIEAIDQLIRSDDDHSDAAATNHPAEPQPDIISGGQILRHVVNRFSATIGRR